MGEEGEPLIRIEENDEDIRFMIQCTQVRLKPKARRIRFI